MSEHCLGDERQQAIRHFIELTTVYTRQQLECLEFSQALVSEAAQAEMDSMVTKTIDDNVSLLTRTFAELANSQVITVALADQSQSAPMQGLGYSTETACYNALVHDGAAVWPILSASQLSFQAKGIPLQPVWHRQDQSREIAEPGVAANGALTERLHSIQATQISKPGLV